MVTWNTSKPATANSVAADVADIEENFDYLEDLLTYWFKNWKTDSALIGKNCIYYVSPAATDQGATQATVLRSAFDLVAAIGASKNAILYMPHLSADGNTTTYTWTTSQTIDAYSTLIVENGVVIAGGGTLTIQGNMIILGDAVISGKLTIASGGTLICLGDLSVSGTLTISAGGSFVENGATIVSGTLTQTGFRSSQRTVYTYANATGTSSSGTGEDDLVSFTLPADSLRVGKTMRIRTGGFITANDDGATATIKFYFGGQSTTVGFYTETNADGDLATWTVDIELSPATATRLEVLVHCRISDSTGIDRTGVYVSYASLTSVNIAAAQVVKFTGQMSEAGMNNAISQHIVTMEII